MLPLTVVFEFNYMFSFLLCSKISHLCEKRVFTENVNISVSNNPRFFIILYYLTLPMY